jgi:hypothetical protein
MNDGGSTLEEAREQYASGYYRKQLDAGLEFQDIVTRALYQRGIVIVGYASRRFQNEEGENMLGAEIKYDKQFRSTGNLYIETAEKAHPDRPCYTRSGIHREDNSWLFVIGDAQTVYIFSTKYLRKLEVARGYRTIEKPTSRGFLLPMAEAEKYCIRRVDLDGSS